MKVFWMINRKIIVVIVIIASCFLNKKAECLTNSFAATPYSGSELPIALMANYNDSMFFYLPKYVHPFSLKLFPAFSTNFASELFHLLSFTNYIQPTQRDVIFSCLVPNFSTPGGRSSCRVFYPPDSSIFGLGAVGNTLRRNGKSFFLWNADAFGFEKDVAYGENEGSGSGKRTYQAHPWLLGVKTNGESFGMFFATSWRAEINITSNFVDFTSDGPPFPVIVIKGTTPAAVLQNFAKLIGKMPIPPLWSLGLHQSRWSYASQEEILSLAKEFANRRIPCSAIWCDIDYMDEFRIFTFNRTNFPDPKKLIANLADYGIKTVWIVDPAVKVDNNYEVYASGTKADVWIKTSMQQTLLGKSWAGECVWPNYIAKKTQEWWKQEIKKFLATIEGAGGLWLDMNEPAVFDSPDGTMPCNALHINDKEIKSHTECHNVYAYYMAQATFEAMLEKNPQKRPFLLTRSGFSGVHKYAATWTGDNLQSFQHLKLSIAMCLNAGLSLQPFIGADVGGFAYSDDTNSLALWMSIGAFYPFYRIHTIKGDVRREPWSMGKDIEEISISAIKTRYRLMPYLYTQFYQHTQNALPVMRPFFFIAPEDAAMHKVEDAFLLGEDILIVLPWANKDDIIRLASKKQKWYKFELDKNGGRGNIFPEMFLRGGAILPVLKEAPVSALELAMPFKDIVLLIAPDEQGRACGILYEDKGDSFDYLNGHYALTEFTFENGKIKSKQNSGKLSVLRNTPAATILR